MEVINSESLTLNQRTFENRTSPVFQKDNSKEIDLMYQQYAVAQSTSSNHSYDAFELHAGLTDKNWEIRQNTLSKLLESIPKLDFDLQLKVTKEIFRLVTINLGHMMTDVRKLALDVIIAFVRNSKDPETITKYMIVYGVDSATIDTNLSLKTIQVLPKVLKYVLQLRGNISHQLLAHIVTSLSKRMIQITHQRQVIASLLQIKLLIGDTMFDHFMETYYPQIKRDFDVLYNVYGTDYSDSSDLSEPEPDSFFIPDDVVKYVDSNMGDMEDLLTQENYTEEMNSDDDVIMKVYDEDGNEIKRNSSRRVTFGGEIVKIRTPDSDATALANNIKEKLDISADIIVQLSSEESGESEGDDTIKNKENEKTVSLNSSCSHIPLPIRPALNKPKHPKQSFKQFKQPSTSLLNGSTSKPEQDLLMEIPNYEGESLTSSSDSSDRSRQQIIMNAVSPNDEQKLLTLKHNTLQDLDKMNINDRLILETLFKKDDWRFYICSVERLSQILCQPHIIQHISSFSESSVGVSLLCYLFNTLSETKNNRVISSSLRALRFLCQAMQSSTLALYLNVIVPTFCSYLQCTNEYNIRLETVEILKMLMRKFSPQTVVNALFTEQCFYSKSSKMRENSLLCLMYALITFPSTDFNMTELIETLIQHGIKEPKRRVRQALLDTLAILGQLVPKSKFKVPTSNEESMIFKRALRARLTRRQLPSVTQSGLILYAFQISAATAFGTDIEWIMAGSGSLSDNYSRPKAQFNFAQGDDISPAGLRDKWDFIDDNKLKLNGYSKNSIQRKCDQLQNLIIRGSSEEALYSNYKYFGSNYIERYSADWTDPKTATSLFETMYGRYPSNLSDMSSYASSYTSEYSFPRLNPGYESNLLSLNRPVSEDKLNRLPWSSKYGGSSKLPLRLEPAICQQSDYYGYKTSSSLPVLSDKKERSSPHFSPSQKVNNYLFEENRHKWSKANEKSNIK